MQSIWDGGSEFEEGTREIHRFLDEKREAQRLREPMPLGLAGNYKTCYTRDNGGFQYDLPSDCKEVMAVSYPKDEITSLLLNEEDYEVTGNKLFLVKNRPQPGKQIQLAYK